MLYKYSYLDDQGVEKEDEIEADSKKDAEMELLNRGILPNKIAKKNKNFQFKRKKKLKTSLKEVLLFTKQFSMMIIAGIPLIQIFELIGEQTKNEVLKIVLKEIDKDLKNGQTLSNSMRKYDLVFNKFYISMIEISELSGTLKTNVQFLVLSIEKELKRIKQVKSALVYPSIISVVALAVMVFMLTFVIPKFMVIFAGSGTELPALTQSVMNLSDLLKEYWYVFIGAIFVTIIVLKKLFTVVIFKLKFDRLILKMPVVGNLVKYFIASTILRNMTILMEAGIGFKQTFETISNNLQNFAARELLDEALVKITEGSSIAKALGETGIFTSVIINMIKIGETSGSLVKSLEFSSNYVESAIDTAVENLLVMLEPIIILVVAIGVGILVVAMYLPLFNMSDAIA